MSEFQPDQTPQTQEDTPKRRSFPVRVFDRMTAGIFVTGPVAGVVAIAEGLLSKNPDHIALGAAALGGITTGAAIAETRHPSDF